MSAHVWYLSVSTYAFCVPGAKHFRGRIRGRGIEIDLDREMTTKERIEANKKEGWTVFETGAMTNAFNSIGDLRSAAIKWIEANTDKFDPTADVMLEGNSAVLDPQYPIFGPLCWLEKASKIWLEWESIDGWGTGRRRPKDDADEILAEKLSKEWEEIIDSFEFER